MIENIIPITIVVGIGLLAGIILTIASKLMAVEVNEAVNKVHEALPGVNCGACGFSGCEDYAKNIIDDKTVKTNLCTPGGSEVAMKISNILGIDFQAVVGLQAIVKCSGTLGNTSYVMEYEGLQSCAANKLFYRGRGACHNACLGYGDCTSVCEFDAIKVVDNVAHVDKSKCVGCGMCVAKCPQHIIKIMPASQKIFVRCSSTDSGGYTKSVCKAGCISCKKCEKVCPVEAIMVKNNYARIDVEKCIGCKKCMEVCPVNVIHLVRE
ncbi:MAG TPA: RnfABCDGE type electron transport complex subunit B [Clostridia bacterium]|nr:RnfABCDGE type electron transport complex subunit B [Clostridia bacterium]